MRRYTLNGKQGFTLAELMAVVAIIAIIASLGLGSYRQAMEKTRMKEGVTGAHALAAAADEYFYQRKGFTANPLPTKMTQIATSLSNINNAQSNENQIVAGHFRYTFLGEPGNPVGIQAQVLDGGYSIYVYFSSIESLKAMPDRCAYTNTKAKDMCMTSGYKTCDDSLRVCH